MSLWPWVVWMRHYIFISSLFLFRLILLYNITVTLHNYLIYESEEDLKTSAVSVLAKLAKSSI